VKHWLLRIMIASNQMINALIGGDPQMSMSARAGFAREAGSHLGAFWCKVLDVPDIHHHNPKYPDDADHCTIAILNYRDYKSQVKP